MNIPKIKQFWASTRTTTKLSNVMMLYQRKSSIRSRTSEQYFDSLYRVYSVRIYILLWINVMHHVKETV
jgi:hypothetical protein